MALKDKGFWKTKITKVWNEEEKYKIHWIYHLNVNSLRCTTQDKKSLVLTTILNFLKDYILDYYNLEFHHNHP
jgi:hypothetical protein